MLIWLQAVVVWGITRLCEASAQLPCTPSNEPGPQILILAMLFPPDRLPLACLEQLAVLLVQSVRWIGPSPQPPSTQPIQ